MITINLLAFRAARKRENIRKQISIFFLTVILLLVLMPLVALILNNRLSDLKGEENLLRNELAAYNQVTREITRIEKRTKETKDRLTVIKDLEKKRLGPVQLLEEVAMSVPADRLWLTSISEEGSILRLEGSAMDNDTVAAFMTNLEKTTMIQSVDLKSTKLQNLPKYKMDASNFALDCKIAARF